MGVAAQAWSEGEKSIEVLSGVNSGLRKRNEQPVPPLNEDSTVLSKPLFGQAWPVTGDSVS